MVTQLGSTFPARRNSADCGLAQATARCARLVHSARDTTVRACCAPSRWFTSLLPPDWRATFSKPVSTQVGHSAVAVMPVPRSSQRSARV